MLGLKNHLVIGLTTYNTALLRVSVAALGRIPKKFLLIIHNDNPAEHVDVRDIRQMGYHGRVVVMNASENIGLMRARLAIVTAARDAKWILFANDDDVVTNADIPQARAENFAIIQNSITVATRLSDFATAITAPDKLIPDGKNIILNRPNIGMAGTLIRFDVMCRVADVLNAAADKISAIDDSLDYAPPTDQMMWAAIRGIGAQTAPDATPIYMDSVNYIKNGLDRADVKYGRPVLSGANAHTRIQHALARYEAEIADAMAAAAVAA